MIYKYSSPSQKTPITIPRKVTLTQKRSPQTIQETKVTSSKKIIIEGTYDPLQSNTKIKIPSSSEKITRVKSTYVPHQEIVQIERTNSQLGRSPQKIVINETSNKQNDQEYRKGSHFLGGTNIYQVSNGIRKVTVLNLFTTKDDIYDGEYDEKGRFNGRGIYYFKGCNVKYEGDFWDGEIHGFGKLSYENPTTQFPIIYEGNFKHTRKHGSGIYYYGSENHFYQGEWSNDSKQGRGKYESLQEIYEGYWGKNKKHGEGCLLSKKNSTEFIGKFYDDYFTQGEIRYLNGDVYVGSFHLGKKQGFGTYIYKTRNQEYQGQFLNDLRHGKGTLKMSNGDHFTGNFRHGRIDESMNCSYRWANGDVFNGWFKNSQPDKGTIKSLKGEVQHEYTSKKEFVQY